MSGESKGGYTVKQTQPLVCECECVCVCVWGSKRKRVFVINIFLLEILIRWSSSEVLFSAYFTAFDASFCRLWLGQPDPASPVTISTVPLQDNSQTIAKSDEGGERTSSSLRSPVSCFVLPGLWAGRAPDPRRPNDPTLSTPFDFLDGCSFVHPSLIIKQAMFGWLKLQHDFFFHFHQQYWGARWDFPSRVPSREQSKGATVNYVGEIHNGRNCPS